MPLGEEPSFYWNQYKPVLLGGGALPLSILMRLPSGEVDLIYCVGLLSQYRRWERRRESLVSTPPPSIPGMTPAEVAQERQQGIAQLEAQIQAWTFHRDRCRLVVEEARQKGYF